jgi:hypothetical protein|tara:strand:+ start:1060 stop:1425 length:366 start_codon:yes stop_codon:yes gene_type:complete
MNFNYKKEHVNKINTPTWVKLNEDSYAERYRKIFIDTYGGIFDKVKRGYVWKEVVQHIVIEPQPEEPIKAGYLVTFPNGKEEVVTNMTAFCKENNLNKSALYGIIRGERKKHKGFKIRKGD